ncbi:MAG: YolD-like family protein [Tepidibacillus sp.]
MEDLRWSSRIILPEHREAMVRFKKEMFEKQKPTLDEQQMMDHRQVRIITYGEYEDTEYKGVIANIDMQYRKLKLEMANDFEWIKLDNILDIILI